MIYRIENDFETCYSFLPNGEDLLIKMPSYSQRFRAKPRLESWVAPIASFYASENYAGKGEQLPDITTWALGNIVFSPKAYNVFKDLLAPSGEFLPMLVGSETYYMFNTLFVIPEGGVDQSQELEVVDAGVHLGQENVLFNENTLEGRCVFKTPTDKLSYSYTTEVFQRMYSQNQFTGLMFEEIHLK